MRFALGIEFGSTRIKAVLVDDENKIVAQGGFQWENQLIRGNVWTYSLDTAIKGVQACYKELKEGFKTKYGKPLTEVAAIGVSGMMHGYLVFDKNGKQLAEFRTWRNTITQEASTILTEKLGFHIPQRWSVAHIYQAILNGEKEVKDIAFATTLAGYFHYLFTGEKVLGAGEASGVFPIDSDIKDYNQGMLDIFDGLIADKVAWKSREIFPKVLFAGVNAGYLTEEGAKLLDPEGDLKPGAAFCPPEGDMGTGMVATNSIRKNTGNCSIGTSSNLTIVTNKKIGIYEEIDVITTPEGIDAALVHVNNGTTEINVVERVIKEAFDAAGKEITDGELFGALFNHSKTADADLGDIVSVDYQSGEPITKFLEGRPLVYRNPNDKLNLANYVRMHMYSLCATIRIGLDILRENEGVVVNKIAGHGGFFTTKGVGDEVFAASINTPVETLSSASQGGPFGMAILASYLINKEEGECIADFLERAVFKGDDKTIADPKKELVDGFNHFLSNYKKLLKIEDTTLKVFGTTESGRDAKIRKLKEEVYEANMRLKRENLITLTWGNVSKIDRDLGVVVIKPSGVPYETMKADDMVVVGLDGKAIDSELNPSSDTPTHIELYKRFKDIGSVVHTHSTYATAFAQAKKPIVALGTTHADTFYGDVPCTRPLTKGEIEEDYELNTGKVIAETFEGKDPNSVPGVLVGSHGPFTWGKDEVKSVDNAIVLEEVAKMAVLTDKISGGAERVDQFLLDKHYNRKHGKKAYYGQKGK